MARLMTSSSWATTQADRGVVHLTAERTDLAVQRTHDPRRGIGLPLDVGAFLAEVVHGALQLLHALLQALAFGAHPVELVTLGFRALRGGLRGRRRRRRRLRRDGSWQLADGGERQRKGERSIAKRYRQLPTAHRQRRIAHRDPSHTR